MRFGEYFVFLGVCLLVLCAEGEEEEENYWDNKVLPGIDTLGWGLDLRGASNFQNALKIPLFNFSYENEKNSYVFPVYPQYVFRHPDGTFVRTAGRVQTETIQSTSDETEKSNLELELGLAGEHDTGRDNATSAKNSKLFSGDLQLKFTLKKLSTNNYLKMTNSLYNSLWHIVVGPTLPLRKRVEQTLESLLLFPADNKEQLLRFIDYYGTHYVDAVLVGGSLKLETMLERQDDISDLELTALISGQFDGLFGAESSLKLNASLNFTQRQTEFEQHTINKLTTTGGNYSVTNFFEGNRDPKMTFEQWLSDLIRNPVVVKVRAMEISSIVRDPELRRRVSAAVADYLGGATPFNPSIISLI